MNKYIHLGVAQAKHDPKESEWYKENNFNQDFVRSLEEGDFIICGTSGCRPFMMNQFGLYQFYYESLGIKENPFEGIATCCFVFGKCCFEERLVRRWSCCKKEITGTFHDLSLQHGCFEVDILRKKN